MQKIVVIGGGISGILTVLELAKTHPVLLLEAAQELLPDSCTSQNQCFKLHTGMHYLGDIETAKTCLLRSIAFARAFPDCIAGGQNLNAPHRRGRHFVMSTSLVSPDEALSVATSLQTLYAHLVATDPKNQIFGPPEHFFRVLTVTEYSHLSSSIPYYDALGECRQTSIALGIETAESLINFDKLRRKIRAKVALSPSITVLTGTKVTDLIPEPESQGYVLYTMNESGTTSFIKAQCIVNCAWQNIELIGRHIPTTPPAEGVGINRIKITLLVKLPEQLHGLHTSLFSIGPYCSITVLENGDAILTSERLTNIGYYPVTEKIPETLEQEIRTKTSLKTAEGLSFAKQILEDCCAYFTPSIQRLMETSVMKELRVGIVKHTELTRTYDHNSIFKMDSVIHSRLDTGVKCVAPGYIVNASMKMTYAQSNAATVGSLIEKQLRLLQRSVDRKQPPHPENFLSTERAVARPSNKRA